MSVLLSLHYLPGVDWLTVAHNNQNYRIEAHENYQKHSMRNRCHIAGPNGIQRLSIPLVKGKNLQTPIRDVRIANDEPWQRQHWRSIKTAYGNAPYFEHYANELERFYEKKYTFLFHFNMELLLWMMEKMGIKQTIELTDFYATPTAPLSDLRGFLFPLDATIVPAATYAQVFQDRHGFLPGLSGIDLLMCCGKQSVEILEKSGTAA